METNNSFEYKKKYLKRYTRINKKIERLEEKLYNLDVQLTDIKPQKITDMPRTETRSDISDIIYRKDEIKERINLLVLESRRIRKEITTKLDSLEDYRQVETLELFFIDGLSLEEIAKVLNFSVRHITRYYSDGIKNLNIDNVSVKSQ